LAQYRLQLLKTQQILHFPTGLKNAKWWSEGSVEDRDLVQGIQYLIQKGMMKVNPPPTASEKQPGGYY